MMSSEMMKRSGRVGGKRRNSTKGYEAEVVRLVTSTGRSSFEVARELGL